MPATMKVPCPVSRNEFAAGARHINGEIAGKGIVLEPKQFSTGSLGYHANGHIVLDIGGKKVPCTMNVLITVSNSKELPTV